MEYSKLLDLATNLGYELAMCGAETFRVEESIVRVLKSYDIEAEAFAIPNCMHISIEPVVGRPLTRMRRIGSHGIDLDAVEKLSNLSRRICKERPDPEIAAKWLAETKAQFKAYRFPMYMIGNFLGAFGFTFLFGGSFVDALLSGCCGLLVGVITWFMDKLGANQLFRTIAAAFPMALAAYIMGKLRLAGNVDAVIIGALMLLVPGLLFTNGMRDIIFGDTNSGVNRIVQVLLIAVGLALGTAAAWTCAAALWGAPAEGIACSYTVLQQCLPAFIACIGFGLLFNIHGAGMILCALGGVLSWVVYQDLVILGAGDISAYFLAALTASIYSEAMARIRKYPAISYLVVSLFPLIPGAGVYYTMSHAIHSRMDEFVTQGMHTAAIAGILAVGILLVSTTVRLYSTWKRRKNAT